MSRPSQRSAAQLALLSILGGLLAASSFFVLNNPWIFPHHRPPHFLLLLYLEILLLLAGGLLAFRSATDLESGIATQRWPEPEIDALRKISRSPLATILTFALLASFMLTVFVFSRFRLAGWSFYSLTMALNFLRSKLARDPSAVSEPTWSGLSPVRSDHWGHP